MANTLILDSEIDAVVVPAAPFSFDGTFHKPSHYPTPDHAYETGTYWQTLLFDNHIYGVRLTNLGEVNHPKLRVTIHYDSQSLQRPDVVALVAELEYRFDLQADLTSFVRRFRSDPVLRRAVTRWRGMRVSTAYSLYEFMVVTTVLQNTVVSRSVQMMNNLFNAFGGKVSFATKDLFHFWQPADIARVDENALRALKLGYRAKTLKKQAEIFVSGDLDVDQLKTQDTESLKKILLKIYGIGPATVQYILFEVFHRYDAIQHIPPWEQKIFSRLIFEQELVDTSVILKEVTDRYGEWKMLALHYLFENAFWMRKHEKIPWLDDLIRL